MQSDPIQEWQRLTGQYRTMSDEELRELAFDFSDLTEPAQQALRSEMRSRGLGDPEAANQAPQSPSPAPKGASAGPEIPVPVLDRAAAALGALPGAPELVEDDADSDDEDDGPHEYTWKTPLCECETQEEARQLSAALRQAGIESWIEGPGAYSRYTGFGTAAPRVLVAADQLEQARAVAARPIPPEIVEALEMDVPEFTPPACPKCGAKDPVLEGVDPQNTWRCEQCGEQWSDPAEE